MERHREQTDRARNLRRSMNAAEAKTWRALPILGKGKVSFRRQHPVSGYYLDFYCAKARLGLELDGSSHDGKWEYDTRRSAALAKHGIEILRIPNHLTDEGNVDVVANWFIEECLSRMTDSG